jgi:tryptophanyl-tRNA synthetase
MKKTVLSGMRPTGKLHLGHLVGALENWVALQQEYECLFMVADWHALMSEYENPSRMREYIYDNVIDWLSVGVSAQKATIFIQSEVKEHLDLFMALSCLVPLGWLERCPTYKEQLRQLSSRHINTYAFLGYPVLQAADILLYKVHKVPVGEDQLAHLELTREIARRFNSLYKKRVFPLPEAILARIPRLLGLDARKMSKSYENVVNLSDSEEIIRKKIETMFTDPKRIKISDTGHPNECNVFSYYRTFFPDLQKRLSEDCRDAKIGCRQCKRELAAILAKKLSPIRERRKELLKNKAGIRKILDRGRDKASFLAGQTVKEVKQLLGI